MIESLAFVVSLKNDNQRFTYAKNKFFLSEESEALSAIPKQQSPFCETV